MRVKFRRQTQAVLIEIVLYNSSGRVEKAVDRIVPVERIHAIEIRITSSETHSQFLGDAVTSTTGARMTNDALHFGDDILRAGDWIVLHMHRRQSSETIPGIFARRRLQWLRAAS